MKFALMLFAFNEVFVELTIRNIINKTFCDIFNNITSYKLEVSKLSVIVFNFI